MNFHPLMILVRILSLITLVRASFFCATNTLGPPVVFLADTHPCPHRCSWNSLKIIDLTKVDVLFLLVCLINDL